MQVLITRPLETAEILAQKINALHLPIRPIIFPAITINPVKTGSEKTTIKNILKNIKTYENIIFISPTAVEMFARYCDKIPPSIKIYCIGKDTGLIIQAKKWGQAVFPHHPYNSENLLSLPALQDIKDQAFLLCQGKGGSNLIKETLTARGAKVKSVILYQRSLPVLINKPDLKLINWIICTNKKSVYNLIQLLGADIKNKRWLVSSEKIKLYAETLGFKYPCLLAKHAGDEAILEALYEINQRTT